MFAFFLDGEFKGTWGNKEGDIFYENTCKSLRWDKSKAVLVLYPDHRETEGLVYEYSVEKVVEKDQLGNVVKEIMAELWAENGLLHKAC